MSIQSEIERISQAKTDIHSAIESKGVTVPDDTLISEMAPYIQQIREAGTVVTSVSNIGPDESGNAQLKNLRIYCGEQDITYNGGAEQTLTINPTTVGAATAAQGALAQTAVQPAQIADFITAEDVPDKLPNPHALSIQLNGGSTTAYDGSAIKNVNITPAAIGAATTSDLEALEPFVGNLSTVTPTQVSNALAQNKQCVITASYQGITYLITSWNRYNHSGDSSTYYVAGSYVESISGGQTATIFCVEGYTSSSSWKYSRMSGVMYTGQPRTSDSEFLTATTDDGLVLEKISATSIGGAPTMHSVADTTYGVGTQNYYGHVRLSDSISFSYGQTSGIAATPLAVYTVNSRVDGMEDSIPITRRITVSTGWSTSYGDTGTDFKYGKIVSFTGSTTSHEVTGIYVAGQYTSSSPTETQKTAAATWTYVECENNQLHFYSPTAISTTFYLIVTIQKL